MQQEIVDIQYRSYQDEMTQPQVQEEEPEEMLVAKLIAEYQIQLHENGELPPEKMQELEELKIYQKYLAQQYIEKQQQRQQLEIIPE
jgi:hypothetical protein